MAVANSSSNNNNNNNSLQLPKGIKQCNLRSRPFTPTMDLSIHNTHGIDVWAPKAPRPWSSFSVKSNTLPSSSQFSKSVSSSLNLTQSSDQFAYDEERRRAVEVERNRILEEQLKQQEQIELQKKAEMERRRLEEEQNQRAQEEELKKRHQEEHLRHQQQQQEMESKQRQQEEQLRRQQEEQFKRQQQEMEMMKRQQEEQTRRQQEEQFKRQQQEMEMMKRQQEEEARRQQEEQFKRQQQEMEMMKRQQEEQTRRQEEEKRQHEELLRRQQEEEFQRQEILRKQEEDKQKLLLEEQQEKDAQTVQIIPIQQNNAQYGQGMLAQNSFTQENCLTSNEKSSFTSTQSSSNSENTHAQQNGYAAPTAMKKALDGIFGGIAGEHNSLVNEDMDYEKHSVRNLVAHFSKTKLKSVPLQYLPQQYSQSPDAPPLNYLHEEAKKKTYSYHQRSEYKKDMESKKSETVASVKKPQPVEQKQTTAIDTKRRNSLRNFFMTSSDEGTGPGIIDSKDTSNMLMTNGINSCITTNSSEQIQSGGTSLRCLSASPTLQQMYKSNNLKPSMPKLYQPNAPQKTNSPASNKPPPAKKTGDNNPNAAAMTNGKKPTVAVAPSPVPSTPPSTPILGTTKEQQLQQLEILKKMELQKALELKEQIELQKKQIEIERSIQSQKRNLEEQLELKRQFEMQRLQFELQKESEMHAQLEIREQQLEIQRQIEIMKQNELKRQAEIQRQIELQEYEKSNPEKLASKSELNSKFNYIEGSSSSSSCSSTESASPMKEYVSETKTYSCSYPATPTPDHRNQTSLNNPYPSLERRLQQNLVNNELLYVQVGGLGNGLLSASPKPNEDLERMVTELASPLPPLEPLPSCLNPPKSNGHLA